jgi:hypothetical protein
MSATMWSTPFYIILSFKKLYIINVYRQRNWFRKIFGRTSLTGCITVLYSIAFYANHHTSRATWRSSLLKHSATSRNVTSSIPDEATGFQFDLILPATLCSWGLLSLYQKWVIGIFQQVKGCRSIRLTTSPISARLFSTEFEPRRLT